MRTTKSPRTNSLVLLLILCCSTMLTLRGIKSVNRKLMRDALSIMAVAVASSVLFGLAKKSEDEDYAATDFAPPMHQAFGPKTKKTPQEQDESESNKDKREASADSQPQNSAHAGANTDYCAERSLYESAVTRRRSSGFNVSQCSGLRAYVVNKDNKTATQASKGEVPANHQTSADKNVEIQIISVQEAHKRLQVLKSKKQRLSKEVLAELKICLKSILSAAKTDVDKDHN